MSPDNASIHPGRDMHDEPESNTIHAAIYARVSTDDQGKGFSIHTQVERCQQYAKEHQMVVWKSHVYIDNGVSGATLDRTALQAMRDVVRSKVVQTVIVYDLDRLTRNLGHQCLLIDEWKKASVQFHTVAQPIDDTPEGQTLRQVLGAFAELEREKIKERSVRGMKERLKSGLPRGTAAPYGYQWTKTSHASTLEINEEEATVVRLIFRWILEGRTLRSIGVQLSREKVLTRRLGQKKTSPWNWSNTSLHRMAHYEGYLRHMYHGKVKGAGKTLEKLPEEGWLEIKIPAIMDQETFDSAAQQLIKNGQTASRRRKRDYLFSASTLRCGQCGNGMNGEAKINRYKPERLIDHIYYRCNTHGRILDGGHCRSTVAAWRLEPLVWSYVERLLSDPAVILESIVVAQYGSLHQRAEVERRLAAPDTELAQFDQRDARLIVAYENDIITAEELKERRADHASQKQRLANEHWDLEQALVTLGAPPPEREALKDYLSHVKAQLKTLSNAEKRRVLDTLHIVVTWTADQPLQVSGSVPSADPGERCPFSDQLVDDLYLTIYE